MSKDIAISSREISVQVVDEGLRVATIGTPGPPGPQGPSGEQGDPSWGKWCGEWLATGDPTLQGGGYTAGSIVTWSPPGAGTGTYYCYQSVDSGIYPSDGNYWMTLASPGGVGGTGATVKGDPGPVGMTWKGGWTRGRSYALRDVVTYPSSDAPVAQRDKPRSAYICIAVIQSAQTPPDENPSHWRLLASAGEKGEQGGPGPASTVPGPPGPPGPGSTVPGPKGDDALAWVAFEFTSSGARRFVAPEAGVLKLAQTKTSGVGTHLVQKKTGPNATPVNLDQGQAHAFSEGDEIIVSSSTTDPYYLVTLVVGPAGS